MKILIFLLLIFCGCDNNKQLYEPTIYQMDSIKNVQAVDELLQVDSLRMLKTGACN